MAVNSQEEIAEAALKVGLPAVIKTVTGGYDGKGQAVVSDLTSALAAFKRLYTGRPLIWERKVPFQKELSVIACRGRDGKAKAYPVAENIHIENILDTSLVPARISAAATAKARAGDGPAFEEAVEGWCGAGAAGAPAPGKSSSARSGWERRPTPRRACCWTAPA